MVKWKKLTKGVAIEINLPYALDKKHTQNTKHGEEKGMWKIKEDVKNRGKAAVIQKHKRR